MERNFDKPKRIRNKSVVLNYNYSEGSISIVRKDHTIVRNDLTYILVAIVSVKY